MDENNSQQAPDANGGWQFRPSDTAGPEQAQTQTAPTAAQSSPQNPQQSADGNVGGQMPAQPMPHPDEYSPAANQAPVRTSDESVSWTASEFIAHQKTIGWYGMLALSTAVLALAILFLTKDKISTGVVVLAAIVFGIYASRKPRTLGYSVGRTGLTIGQKTYTYDQFRSFSLLDEGAFSSIVFMPLKRFMPLLTIYYDPKDEQQIVTTLSDRLPMETHHLDLIDQLMRRVRF